MQLDVLKGKKRNTFIELSVTVGLAMIMSADKSEFAGQNDRVESKGGRTCVVI